MMDCPPVSAAAKGIRTLFPSHTTGLLARPDETNAEAAYVVAKHLFDALDWKWVLLTWIDVGDKYGSRPFLYALPSRLLKTPSDENMVVPVAVTASVSEAGSGSGSGPVAETEEDKQDKQVEKTDSQPTPVLPPAPAPIDVEPAKPEWILPCYEDELTSVAAWTAIFDALVRHETSIQSTGLTIDALLPSDPVPNRPFFDRFVQLFRLDGVDIPTRPDHKNANSITTYSAPPSAHRQIVSASVTREGAVSYAVVRPGFINRAVR